MRSEWPSVRLGDHVDACLGKMLDAKKNKGALQPYLGNSNVRWGRFDLNDLAAMRFEPHEDERYGLEPGDLVVCEGGEPGRCAVWTAPVPKMKIQKALHRIRPKATLDNYYLYYWFRHAAKAGQLEPFFTGTTIRHLTGQAIAALEVPLPPVAVQVAVVDVLRSLDERIDLLRQTNATLETIAQALFKSWFIDFDPVRAKAVGREPEGMDAATAALFPAEFEESALGLIPKGWRSGSVADAVEFNPVRSLAKGASAPYLEMANAPTIGHRPIDPVGLRAFGSGCKFRNGDALLAKITPCLENGKSAFVDFLASDEVGWGSTEFIVLRSKPVLPEFAAYLLARHEPFRQFAVQAMTGTSGRQRVELSRLAQFPMALPPNASIAQATDSTFRAIRTRIAANDEQAHTLARLRDALLPRLVSGTVRLTEPADPVEATPA